jgi:hypothetical protein
MFMEMLYGNNLWLIFGITVIIFFLATEAGFRVARTGRSNDDEAGRSEIGTLQGAILGLLALLMGFTFSMALSRYEVRKMMVLDESNAIGTTYLRTQMLPEPQKTDISRLLRQYVDARLEGVQPGKFHEAIAKSEKLHDQLWLQATAVENKEPRELITALFIQSLNETIDIHAIRLRAIVDRIPEIVWLLLFAVTIFGMGLIGYGCGFGNKGRFIMRLLMAGLIALVIVVIIDLDQPQRGLIKISQQSMMSLRESINKPAP